MKWLKVKIDYFSNNLEQTKAYLIGIFEEIGIKEIEVMDYFSNNVLDYDINYNGKRDIWSIIGYILDNRFSKKKLEIILDKLDCFLKDNEDFIYEIYTSNCSDDDWKDEWKKYFHTVEITKNIIVKPSWDTYDKKNEDESKIVIEIDPGMAFGTGTHETTSLCVEFLEKYSANRKKLLDIGCGSGILMLIGKKLGVERVVGIDIDKGVEEVVKENFIKNNIIDNYEVFIGNLVDKIDEKYDLVVSNILVDVLTQLLESIEKVLEKNSKIIFSGILRDKEEEFLRKTKEHNLVQIDRNEKNNWVSLVFEYRK